MTKQEELLALFCPQKSSIEQQLLWLFGLELTASNEIHPVDLRESGRKLDFAARYVLELINIEVVITEDDHLEGLLSAFGGNFPSTKKFSEFARKLSGSISAIDDPDGALLTWMDMEERLFRTLERHIVGERLKHGFITDEVPDVDGFVNFSLGVQNRRKSRAGWAFGNHIEALLLEHSITYKREGTTEKRNGPDFLFPGEAAYHDPSWSSERLTMLGAKTSCKDRWRQVLAEANRIDEKHLITLEPGISGAQTEEMKAQKLRLVVPSGIHQTYREQQRAWLFSVLNFLELVKSRQ